MGRPKTINKKKGLSISINIELDELLDNMCKEKNINKSKYIEYLIKKEIMEEVAQKNLEKLGKRAEEKKLHGNGDNR